MSDLSEEEPDIEWEEFMKQRRERTIEILTDFKKSVLKECAMKMFIEEIPIEQISKILGIGIDEVKKWENEFNIEFLEIVLDYLKNSDDEIDELFE